METPAPRKPLTAVQARKLGFVRQRAATGDLRGCAILLDQLLAELPDHAELQLIQGRVALQSRRWELALEALRRAHALAPGSDEIRTELGFALVYRGQFAEARALLEDVVARDADNRRARHVLIEACSALEDFGVAQELLADGLAESPPCPDCATQFARISWHVGRESEAIALMRALRAGEVAPRHRLAATAHLAELLDRAGDCAAAFPLYAEANRLRGASWNAERQRARTRATIAAWTPEAVRARAGHGVASEAPVFVVGMPRSGSTLVEQILDCHGAVHGAGELARLPAIAAALGGEWIDGVPHLPPPARLDARRLGRAGSSYLDALARLGGAATRVVDKLPVNAHLLGLVALMLPGARVIHVRRDPLDTCVSCFCTQFHGQQPFSHDLADCGAYLVELDGLMAHWGRVLELPILEVRYEDLVDDVEREARRMLAFLDVPWQPEVVAFHRNPRVPQTASRHQVRRPVYRSAIGRHRRFEAHLGPLREALRRTD